MVEIGLATWRIGRTAFGQHIAMSGGNVHVVREVEAGSGHSGQNRPIRSNSCSGAVGNNVDVLPEDQGSAPREAPDAFLQF